MSTIKSSSEHLTLNADGSGKTVKLQNDGTTKLATTPTGIDVTGTVTADGLRVGVPATFWSGYDFYDVGGLGNITTQGAYEVGITSNGYRNTSGTWNSLGVNGKAGAAQISLAPTGTILFRTDASKASGTTSSPTERMRISSTGYVSMPKLATSFCRLKGPSSTLTVSASFTSMQVVDNPDNLYDSSNGRFTCPVNGLYYMNAMSINQTYYGTTASAKPYKNGVEIPGGRMYVNQTHNHGSASATVLVRCSAGDYLQWRHNGSLYALNHANNNYMLVHAE